MQITEEIVDFSGRGLKLDNEEDAKQIVDAIKATKSLTCLKLEGNTLGVDAAKAIAKALESQPHFQKALWKDAFTGRLKDEIPRALNFLGGGLILAQAHLAELDLSDNALGPVGMEGLVAFLKSPVCFSLKTLRLNNNGLGIYGGRMLAKALIDCLQASKEACCPLSLKTFIVGRNRLENEGALALSEFFKAVGTLEEVQMPQNFIRHPGIAALAEAFVQNKALTILNLNDNTFTWRGSHDMALVLPKLQRLKIINFGDCLIRTKGAEFLAKALSEGHLELEEVYMDHGEINLSGAKQLANAMKNKTGLKVLDLNGNQFGEEGCDELKELVTKLAAKNVLQSLSDDEGEPDSEEEEEEEVEEEEEEEDGEIKETEEEEAKESVLDDSVQEQSIQEDPLKELNACLSNLNTEGSSQIKCTVEEFLLLPSLTNLNGLGPDKRQLLVEYLEIAVTNTDKVSVFDVYSELVMKLCAAVSLKSDSNALETVQQCVDDVLQSAFHKASGDKLVELNNSLLVHMGLIKSEDKAFKLSWPLSGAFVVLKHVISQSYMPKCTLDVLEAFFTKPQTIFENYKEETHSLKQALSEKMKEI